MISSIEQILPSRDGFLATPGIFSSDILINTTIIPSVSLIHYINVYVTYTGVVINDFRVDKHSIVDQLSSNYNFLFGLKTIIKKRKRFLPAGENYALIFDEWSTNYFHFLCDVVPRLLVLKDNINFDVVLLLPFNINDVYKDLLKFLGYENHYVYRSWEVCYTPRLIMPSHVFKPSGVFDFDGLQRLHFTLRNIAESLYSEMNFVNQCERIFISRSKAKSRKLINELEVLQLLAPFGFKVVYAEDLSVVEQAKLFFTCRVLLSSHGAGLSNMLYMKTGSAIIELRADVDAPNNTFLRLAKGIGHHYYSLKCDANSGNFQEADLSVELGVLENLLKSVLY